MSKNKDLAFYIQQECRRMQRHFADMITDFTQQLQEMGYIFDTKSADIANLNTETPEFKKVIRPISEPVKVTLKGELS